MDEVLKEVKAMLKSTEKKLPEKKSSQLTDFENWMEGFFNRGLRPLRDFWPDWEDFRSHLDVSPPKVDVIEKDQEVIVKAEIPGVKEDDIDLTITNDGITIKGSYSHEEEIKEEEYRRTELTKGSFARSIPFPTDVVSDKAVAKLKDGILTVTVPKLVETKQHKVRIQH